MATAAAIRARVFEGLYNSTTAEWPYAQQVNDADITAGELTFVVDDGAQFEENDIIEFQDNGEQVIVVSVSTNTITVRERGAFGTTAAAHADNIVIYKNPVFGYTEIDNEITAVMAELEGMGVHAWGTGSDTLVASQNYYDQTETDIVKSVGIVAVYYPQTTSLLPVSLPFRWFDGLHSTVSTTAHGISLYDWKQLKAGDTFYFSYAQVIDATTDLLSRQEELVVAGAVFKTLAKAESGRSLDPGKMTDRTVQPGQKLRDSAWWRAEYMRMVGLEQSLLKQERRAFPGTMRENRASRWSH